MALRARDADVEQVALHLLVSEPSSDPSTVATLRQAANTATRRGDPGTATVLLRRALLEPAGIAMPEVTYDLGAAEAATGDPAGIDRMVQGVMTLADPVKRARRALIVGNLQTMDDRIEEAVTTFSFALNGLDGKEPELALSLRTSRFWAARQGLRTFDEVKDQLHELRQCAASPDGAAHRAVLATLAREAANQDSIQEANSLLDRALASPGLGAFLSTDSLHYGAALLCLCCVERFEDFDTLVESALTDAGRNGNLLAYFVLTTYRSWALLRRGRLVEAEQAARSALALDLGGWTFGSPALVGVMVGALLEQGRIAEARTTLEQSGVDCASPNTFPVCLVLESRGRLRLAEGDLRRGLADLLLAGQRLEALRVHSPAMLQWRSHASMAHLKLGERDAALRLAREEVRLAHRLCGPSTMGTSLHSLGLATGGHQGIRILEHAVNRLKPSSARLAEASALVDLGAALRRQGQPSRARVHLREGLDQATRCQATGLAERAHLELLAAGARPRRVVQHGPEALTATEARIAMVAAQGLTNTEIGQSLFISRKTVEKHLANAYRKLQISSRSQLDPTALTGAVSIAADPPSLPAGP
jgi:DNA-binding CsgD family transcriptional regulator